MQNPTDIYKGGRIEKPDAAALKDIYPSGMLLKFGGHGHNLELMSADEVGNVVADIAGVSER